MTTTMMHLPDPADEPDSTSSPFDRHRHLRPDGTEFWTARDLQRLSGYPRWQDFRRPLERAMAAAQNTGIDVAENFRRSPEVSGKRGPAREDYELSRYGAYLVALNGDPRKPEVAAAQSYFVIRTRQAETATPVPALPQTYEEALDALLGMVRAQRQAETRVAEVETRVAELEPAARAWNGLVAEEGHGDYSLAEAAKLLARYGVTTGQNRLLAAMRRWNWVDRHGEPYQRLVERGLLRLRPLAYRHPHTGEARLSSQVRVTAAGVAAAYEEYTKERQLPLLHGAGPGRR